jgi:branched-chain amino acid transport system permease protein
LEVGDGRVLGAGPGLGDVHAVSARSSNVARGRPISLLIQVIITGISIGAVYGLLAICISVIYRLTGIVHLAIGELAGIAIFTTVGISFGRQAVAGAEPQVPLAIGLVLALALTAGAGAVVYRVAIAPFVKRGFSIAWVGGIVALAIVLRGLIQAVFPRSSYTFVESLPTGWIASDGVLSLGGNATLQARTVFVGVLALLLCAGAGWLLNRSRWGVVLRAISEDRLAAAFCGVAVERWLLAAFAVSALLAGGVACVALSGTSITVNTTTLLGVKGLVAAVVARFGTPARVLSTALLVGVAETALSTLDIGPLKLGPGYSAVIPVAVAVVLLAFWSERSRLQERA